MKCNSTQKRTVYELSAIQKRWSSSKKSVFRKKKSVQKLLKKKKNWLFKKKTNLFESPIAQKRFIFLT